MTSLREMGPSYLTAGTCLFSPCPTLSSKFASNILNVRMRRDPHVPQVGAAAFPEISVGLSLVVCALMSQVSLGVGRDSSHIFRLG